MSQNWHSSEQIQRIVRRRRWRRSLAAGVAVVALAGTAVGISASDSPHHPAPLAIAPTTRVGDRIDGSVELVADASPLPSADARATQAVAQADVALAVAMLQHADLLKDDLGGANVSTSPLSLYLALGMVANGARGATASEIERALQASGIDLATQNLGLEQLTSAMASSARQHEITLETANSLWQQQGFVVKPAFLTAMASYFHAGVWQTDFAGHPAQAVSALNQWTSEHTHGKITRLFDQLDPSTVLVLANALYFHAAWQVPFDPAETRPTQFTSAAGQPVTVPFMQGDAAGLRTATYQATALPYNGGRFEALAVMPTTSSLSAFVGTLSAARLAEIATRADASAPTGLMLPKFTVTTSMNLVPALEGLGMRTAFAAGADFSGISATGTSIDQARQRVYLDVGEAGTTAAAVTGFGFAASAINTRQGLTYDHPFLFLIRDRVSGAVLFASEVNDPSS